MVKPSLSRWFLPALFLLAGGFTVFLVRQAATAVLPEQQGYVHAAAYAVLAIFGAGLVVATLRRIGSRLWWEGILTLTVFLGIWFALLLVLPLWLAVILASLLTLTHLFLRVVVLHDLFYLIGSVGVAVNLAAWLPSEVLVVGLVGFTLYDMVAGLPGGPVVSLATTLARWGVVPGFILPARPSGFVASVDNAIRFNAALLGAGDVILPLTLVARASLVGMREGAFVVAGMVVGSVALSLRKDLHPRAALLPLAIGSAIPFLAILIARYYFSV